MSDAPRPARDGETLSAEPDFEEMSDSEVADYWCKVCGEVEDENETLRSSVAALRAELDDAQMALTSNANYIDALQAANRQADEEIRALRAQLADARAAFEQALSRTNDLTGRLGAAITERTVLRDCVWKLSAAMLEAKIWTDEHEAMFERATGARHVPRNWRRAARAASGEDANG